MILSGYKLGYTLEEYEAVAKGIVGSLVALSIDGENYGVGVILQHRRFHGEFHIKVAWLNCPHFNFRVQRNIEWLNYERVSFISKS